MPGTVLNTRDTKVNWAKWEAGGGVWGWGGGGGESVFKDQ